LVDNRHGGIKEKTTKLLKTLGGVRLHSGPNPAVSKRERFHGG